MPIYNPQTGLYQADPSAYSDVVAAKTNRLQERTAAKQARLSPTTKLQQDILLGMNDADSLITRNFGGNTRSASKLDDYYDAVELDHGPDNLAIDAARDNKWKANQFDLVSTITGKPVEALTNQDFIDVGNQQQIQKLADLARGKDEPRWTAPLIEGATQTNLTGQYTDEFGRPTNIPLDVNIGSKYLGETDKYGRPLVDFTDAQGVDVTGMHSQDPTMNANYVEPADLFGAEANGSYIGNLVDSAQFGVGRKIAGVADAVVDTATRGVLEAQKKYYGWTEEEAVNNLVKNSSLFKRDPKTGDFIGFDKYKTAEYYGYDNSRSQNAMDEIGKAKGFADTFLAIAKNVDAAPDLFLESSGELLMGVFKAPGLILNAFDYANQAMEDTIEAQGGKPLTNGQRAIDTLAGFGMAAVNKLGTDEMIGRTKFVKGLVGAASNKSKSAAINIAKELGKSALIVAGKAGYEGVEEILQESMGILATKYNIGAEEIFDNETITQLKQAFGGGVLGGGFPAAVGVAKDTILSDENSAKFNEIVEGVKNKAKSATEVPADVAGAVNNDTTTKPTGPIYSAVQGKSFEEASAMVSEQVLAMKEELAELQKTQPDATLADITKNRPQEYMDDLKEAGKYVKAMQDTEGVNETINTGKLSTKLNATPEEEHNIINAYIQMEDAKLAEFEKSLTERGADAKFPDDTPEQMAQIIDTAKAKRAAYNELSQLDKTRQSVATEGVSKTKKGFISYFQDAITSPAGSEQRERSKGKLSKFTASQIAKRDKLEAARSASVTPTVNTINNIANSTKRPAKDVWMAMTYASNISNKMGDPKFKEMYESFTPAEQKRMDVDTGIEVVDYASEHYNVMNDAFNRAEGTFEINGKTTLLDAANELGISTKVLGGKWAEGSGVTKTIKHTTKEIEAMTHALNLIDKNTKRKATPTTGTTTETSPEVPTEPVEGQTASVGTVSPVKEEKGPGATSGPINIKPTVTKAPEEYKKDDPVKLFSQVSIKEGPLAGKHVTLEFNPESPANTTGPAHIANEGEPVNLKITGEYKDANMHYYTVDAVDANGNTVTSTQSDGAKPLHITVSTAEGIKPVETGKHAQANPDAITKIDNGEIISGVATFGTGKYTPDFGKTASTTPSQSTSPSLAPEVFNELTSTPLASDGSYDRSVIDSNTNELGKYTGTRVKYEWSSASGTGIATGTIVGSDAKGVQLEVTKSDGNTFVTSVPAYKIKEYIAPKVQPAGNTSGDIPTEPVEAQIESTNTTSPVTKTAPSEATVEPSTSRVQAVSPNAIKAKQVLLDTGVKKTDNNYNSELTKLTQQYNAEDYISNKEKWDNTQNTIQYIADDIIKSVNTGDNTLTTATYHTQFPEGSTARIESESFIKKHGKDIADVIKVTGFNSEQATGTNTVYDGTVESGSTSPVEKIKAPESPSVEVEDTLPGYRLYSVDDEASKAVTREEDDGTILLDQVATEPSARRKGYSKAVIGKVIEDYGDKDIKLSAEPKAGITMSELVSFYKSMGFKVDTIIGIDKTAMTRPANGASESQKGAQEAPTESPKVNAQEEVKEPVEDVIKPKVNTKTIEDDYTLTPEEELEVDTNAAAEEQRMYEENEKAKKDDEYTPVQYPMVPSALKIKNPFLQKYLATDIESADIATLINMEAANTPIEHGTHGKESQAVIDALKTKRERINELINEYLATTSMSPERREKIKAKITKLVDRRAYLIDEVASFESNMEEIKDMLEPLDSVASELREMYKERDELNTKFSAVFTPMNNARKALGKIIGKFNSKDTRKGYADGVGRLSQDTDSKGFQGVVNSLNSHINELETEISEFSGIKKAIAYALQKILKAFATAKDTYDKAAKAFDDTIGDMDAFKHKQAVLNNRITALEHYAKFMYGDGWRADRREAQALKRKYIQRFNEIKTVNAKVKPLQRMLRGTAVTLRQLQNDHGFKGDTAIKGANVAYKDDRKKYNAEVAEITKQIDAQHRRGTKAYNDAKEAAIAHLVKPLPTDSKYKTKKGTTTRLANMLTVGNATSYLASYNVTNEDMGLIFKDNEFNNYQFNASLVKWTEDKYTKGLFIPNKITAKDLAKFPYKMLMRNNDGTLNPNVAAAMKVATIKYMSENADTLTQLTTKDLASMYNVKEEEAMGLAPEVIMGGIPQSYIANSIGKDIMKMLGIKPIITKDIDGNTLEDTTEFYEKITTSIGMAAVDQAVKAGNLEQRSHTLENGSIVYTYKLAEYDRNNLSAFKADNSKLVKELDDRFGIEPNDKRVIHRTPGTRKAEDITKRNEPMTKPSPIVADSVVASESREWRPSMDVIKGLLSIPRENLAKILGHKDPDDKTLTAEESISRLGKNRQIEKDINNLEMLVEEMKLGTEGVYFRWFVASNSRQFIDAKGGLNPQGIKLHRYVLTTAGMRGTVDYSKDDMSSTIFELGFAQGLGFAIDKNPVADSRKFAKTMMTSKNLDTISKALYNGHKEVTIDGYKLEFEEPAHTVLAVVEGRKKIAAKGKPFETTMVMEVDGLTNGFAHKIMQYLATDDASSYVITDKTIEWLAKVGIAFNTKEEATDMVTRIKLGADPKGVVDAYLTLAEGLSPLKDGEFSETALMEKLAKRLDDEEAEISQSDGGTAQKIKDSRIKRFGTDNKAEALRRASLGAQMLGGLRDEATKQLTKTARLLLKYPFMIFGYGAGFEAMSNNIVSATIDEIMHEVLNNPKSQKTLDILESLGVDNPVARNKLFKELKEKPYNGIILEGKRTLLDGVRGIILGVYGDTVADIMGEHLGGIKEINKGVLTGTTILFKIFSEAYQAELKKRGLTGIPNKEVNDEILEVLRAKKLLPIVRGPVSENYDQGIAMYSRKDDKAAENEYGDPEYDLGSYAKNKYNIRDLEFKRKGYDGPGAAGLVGLVNIGDSLNTALAVLAHDTLEVFDAFVIGVNQADVVSDANKDFAEMNLDESWNSLDAVLEAVENMSESAQEYPGLLNAVFESILTDRGYPAGRYETLDTIVGGIHKLNNANKARIQDFKSRGPVTFEQIVLDKKHAFEYNGITEKTEAVKDILNKYDVKDADSVIAKISNSLEDILGCTNG